MADFQSLIFQGASTWSTSTSLVVFGIGTLFCLQGFRFARFLIAGSCAAAGYVLGTLGARFAGLPPFETALATGALIGIVSMVRYPIAVSIASICTFAALGQYAASRFGMLPDATYICAAVGAALGAGIPYVMNKQAPIIVTSFQGAAMMVIAFVGLTSRLAPTLSVTFIAWSARLSFMVPVLLTMLIVLGYSVQANQHQGDITSGGTGERDLADV